MRSIAIIGGGASGLSAAIEALRTGGVKVTLYERLPRVGKKLLSTGNGRCNLSNRILSANCYHGDRTLIDAALDSRFSDTVNFFVSLGVLLTEEDGRLYPKSESASSVADALRFAALSLGCLVVTDAPITAVERNNTGFSVNGEYFDAVILACGGAASPDLGSDGSGYTLLQSLGHTVRNVRPALVALRSDNPVFRTLKGVRVKATAALLFNGTRVAGDYGEIQFTDCGLSGIPIFNLSGYINPQKSGYSVRLDFCPDIGAEALIDFMTGDAVSNKPTAADALFGILPKRLGEAVLKKCGLSPSDTPKALAARAKAAAAVIKAFDASITGTNGFRTAQVSAGGVSSKETDPLTLESKKIPGLYICGELLDVDGICGGYNLQFAFTTGRIAGYNAVKGIKK